MGGDEPVEADQGETGETRRVGSFSEGASRRRCAPVKGEPVLSTIKPRVTRLMMCLTNQPRVYLYSAQVLAAETLDHFTTGPRSDSGWGWCRYPRRVGGLKGTHAIRATQRPRSLPDTPQTCPGATRNTQ